MKMFKSFCLFTLLFLLFLGQSRITYISTAAQPNPVNMDAMSCIKNAGFLDQVIVEGYQWANLTWWLTSDPQKIKTTLNLDTNLVFKPFLYIKDSIELSTNLYANWLNSLPLKSAWLNVPDLQDDITCQYATNFALLLSKKVKVKFGIYASAALWQQKFKNGCNSSISALPLFAFPTTATFFKPFAGWTKYQYVGSNNGYQYNLCNINTLYGIQTN